MLIIKSRQSGGQGYEFKIVENILVNKISTYKPILCVFNLNPSLFCWLQFTTKCN